MEAFAPGLCGMPMRRSFGRCHGWTNAFAHILGMAQLDHPIAAAVERRRGVTHAAIGATAQADDAVPA